MVVGPSKVSIKGVRPLFLDRPTTRNERANRAKAKQARDIAYAAEQAAARAQANKNKEEATKSLEWAKKNLKSTQDFLKKVDVKIKEYEKEIDDLSKISDLGEAFKKAVENRERTGKENFEYGFEGFFGQLGDMFKKRDPITEAVTNAKKTKDIYDVFMETFSYDSDAPTAFDAGFKLDIVRIELEKIKKSRETLIELEAYFLNLATSSANQLAAAENQINALNSPSNHSTGSGNNSSGFNEGPRNHHKTKEAPSKPSPAKREPTRKEPESRDIEIHTGGPGIRG